MQICRTAVAACLGLVLLMVSAQAHAQYRITNLVSNQVHQAPTIDPLLANAWGLARGATGPWWISDNDTGWSTIYDATGKQVPLRVLIPTAGKRTGFADRPKRPGHTDENRFQRIVDGFPGSGQAVSFPFRDAGWHNQRMGAGSKRQPVDARGGQLGEQSDVHGLGHHQQPVGEFPLRGG